MNANPYYSLASYAYNHRAQIKRGVGTAWKAGKTIAKFVQSHHSRKRKRGAKFSMRRIGNPKGSSTCKSREGLSYSDTPQDRTLIVMDVVSRLPHSPDDNINARSRNVVNISGFKYCFHVRNNFRIPLSYHFAVCVDKKHGNEPYINNFFRAPGEGNNRSQNFSDQLSGLDMKCQPINTDRYIVLRHERYTIPGAEQSMTYNANGRNNFMTIEKYVKVNRQIRFEGHGDDTSQTRILIFIWTSQIDAISGDPGVQDVMRQHVNTQTYFREVK